MNARITDQSEDILEAEFEEGPTGADDQAKIEEEILSEFDAAEGDVTIKCCIYAAGEKGHKDEFLFDCSPADLPGVRDRLIKKYGTGTYRTRVYKDGKVARYLTYRVRAELGAVSENDGGTGGSVNDPLYVAVQNQSALLEAMVAKISEPPPVAVQNNPMEMISVMGAMMGTMRDIMGPANAAPAMDPMQLFDLFTKGFEMARDNNSDSGETNVLDVVRDLLKSPMISELAKAPAAIAAPQNAPVIPAPQPATQTVPVEEPENTDPILQGLIGYMVQFLPQAQRGADPGLYADLIVDNVEPHLIRHVLDTPNIEDVIKSAPGIGEHWPWYAQILAMLRDSLTEDEESETVPDTVDVQELDNELPADVHDKTAFTKPEPKPEPATRPDAGPRSVAGNTKRKSGDKNNPAANVKADKGGKKAPGNKAKSGGTGKRS